MPRCDSSNPSRQRALCSPRVECGGLLIAYAVASVGWPRVVQSQVATAIPDAASCERCRILTRPSMTLQPNARGDGLVLQPPNAIIEDAQRRIWVLGDAPMQIFAADGMFQRVVGAKGRGPNEYVMPIHVAHVNGDSLVVFDAMSGRTTVLDKNLVARRNVVFPYLGVRGAAILRWPDSVVVSGWIRTTASAGYPLHLMSFRGNDALPFRSFGSSDGKLRMEQQFEPTALITIALDGRPISIDPLQYEISVWRRDGSLLERFARSPAWFSKRSRNTIGGPVTAPSPMIAAISVDDQGLCWVFAHVPSRHWQRAWEGVKTRSSEVAASSVDFTELYDTQLEILDLGKRRVVARALLEGRTASVLTGSRVVLQANDAGGNPTLRVVPLVLSR